MEGRDARKLHTDLIFDEVFFSQLDFNKDEQAQLLQVTRTMSDILLLTVAYIKKWDW